MPTTAAVKCLTPHSGLGVQGDSTLVHMLGAL